MARFDLMGRMEIVDFAAGFFAGLQVCFTGSTDNEMYLIGKAGIIGGAPMWSDGEPMDYQPYGCNPPNLPYNDYVPVIGVVNYTNQTVCWFAIGDTTYSNLPSNCQYFLCKMDGH
ncbi:hypothetical protein WR25_12820 [Diploscapter pachys]|uniref:Uncharacterized protein n=1 Tax=Diploscapter pachys TaxID=2018661 RepID=A0A2A2KXU0_9BILA|nr:hypothetical protein WR25_12820 [Diploscapter pachys]